MAARYWVGGGSSANWDATGNTNWGSASNTRDNASVPTAADDVIFDNSANGNSACTINGTPVCRSIDTTAYTNTITHSAGVTLTIGDATAGTGNVALAFGTFTYTLGNATTSAISFVSTSATQQTVNFNGKTTGNITFNASSNGSWKLTGGHTIGTTGTFTLTKGTLDVNGQTVSWGLFNSSNSNTRSLTLGAATITITGGNATVWDIGTTTGLTLSANNVGCTITCNGTIAVFTGGTGNTYNDLVMSGSGGAQLGNSNTFRNLTRTGTASKTDTLTLVGANTTVTGTLTLTSNSSINRLLIQGVTLGTSRTITAAAVVINNIVDFQDIAGAGAATWTVAGTGATALGDCGGNSGITFSSSVQQTWSGTSGGNWSANAWTTRVPLPQDDVIISSAFSASQTITSDMPRLGRSVDWTGSTGSPTWSAANVSFFGSMTLISGMTLSTSGTFIAGGRSSYTMTSAGKTHGAQVLFNCPSGTYTLNDALVTTSNCIHNDGTLLTNGFSLTTNQFTSNSGRTRALTLSTSNVILTTTSTTSNWNVTSGSLTFSGASSTITISTTSANTRTFAGAGLTYGTLTYTVAGSTGGLNITGANSFGVINFSDVTNARTLRFTAATTTTIRDRYGFNVQGTSGKLMTVDSITAATHTIVGTDIQACNFLSVKNSIASGGKFFAGYDSTNVSGNTGWIFASYAPSLATIGV